MNLIYSNNIDYSKYIGDLKINFKSKKNKNIYVSELSIFNKNNSLVYNSNFINDENIDNFKVINNDKVIELSKKNNSIDKENLILYINTVDKFLDFMVIDLKGETLNINQIWFHYSALKINERFLSSSVCECTVHPSYLVGKTNFICLEDHIISAIKLKEEINLNSNTFNDESSKKLLTFLNSYKDESISFKKVYDFYYPISDYKSDIKSNSTERRRCLLGLGSSHGCCGNYSGCCYYVNPICHIHDAMCSDCKPRWFCLSGCVPD